MNKQLICQGPIYQIRAFRTGKCRVQGKYSYYRIGHETDHAFNIYLTLIEGDNIRALVDTGMESVDLMNQNAGFLMTELITQEAGEDTVSILNRAGISPFEIDYVFLTHCHYDHCSNLPLFTKAVTVIPATAWKMWHEQPETARYLHSGFYEYLHDLNAQSRLRLEDDGIVVPGIGVERVGGHTPCSQFVYVNTRRGVAALTGDTVQMYRNVSDNEIIGIFDHEKECWKALETARQADVLIPGHDPRLFEIYPGGLIS